MNYLTQNFKVSYELENVLINTVGGGVLENGTAYSPSVKITSTNTYEIENKKTGFADNKQIDLVIKISCLDDSQAGYLATKIKEYYSKSKKLTFFGGIQNNSVVTLSETADYYIEYFTNALKDLSKK